MDSLKYKTTRKAIKLAIQNLPKGLDTAYSDAIERIEAQVPDHLELAKQILSWITHAPRPLSVMELQHALAVEVGETELHEDNIPEMEDMAAVCAGLVVIDEESNIIRLVHYTTQEYFERISPSWIPDPQTDITVTCLTYLSFDSFSVGFCSSDEQLDELLRNNVFVDYASRLWGFHARKASIDRIEPSLRVFFSRELNMRCSSQILMSPIHTKMDWQTDYSQFVPKHLSATHLAAYHGLDQILRVLFNNSHPTDPRDSHGRTPLSYAAERGHEAVVMLLLARNDVDAYAWDIYGWTPLFWAAYWGHKAVVELLVACDDVEADLRHENGMTPLSWAAHSGHEAVVKLLVARNDVDADSRDNEGKTPLLWAAYLGHEGVVKLLVAHKDVEADSRDNEGRTPLSYAASSGHEAVVELLVARNDVEADSRDSRGRTPLFYAAENGQEAVVKLLIARDDVETDSRDCRGETPLSLAVRLGLEEILELLIASGAEANSRDPEGRTPLVYAAHSEREALVKLLIASGAEVDARDEKG